MEGTYKKFSYNALLYVHYYVLFLIRSACHLLPLEMLPIDELWECDLFHNNTCSMSWVDIIHIYPLSDSKKC